MRSVLKLVAVNLLVLAGLWVGALLALSVGVDLYDFARSFTTRTFKRAELPAYADHARAQQVHVDQKSSIKDYVPYIEWRHSAEALPTLNIGPDGYRTHSAGLDNAPDATTIGFFGGSTMWGTGVDDDNTIPARFDAITTDYRVFNYAERGFTSMQNLVELMTLINTGRAPKTVVFYEGFNDVWVHCNRAVTERLNSHAEERRLQSALDRTADENFTWNNFVAPMLTLIYRLADVDAQKSEPACSTDPQRAEAVAEMLIKNLEMAERLVTSYGGSFHAFLQPTAYSGKARTDYLDLGSKNDRDLADQLRTVYPLVRAKMAERKAPWFADLSTALDGDARLLIDDAHLAEPGNALVAETMKAALGAR
jgi:hypothetical protein